jgi:hypothetical protein
MVSTTYPILLERTEGKKSKNIMDSETDFIFNLALGNSKNGHIRSIIIK